MKSYLIGIVTQSGLLNLEGYPPFQGVEVDGQRLHAQANGSQPAIQARPHKQIVPFPGADQSLIGKVVMLSTLEEGGGAELVFLPNLDAVCPPTDIERLRLMEQSFPDSTRIPSVIARLESEKPTDTHWEQAILEDAARWTPEWRAGKPSMAEILGAATACEGQVRQLFPGFRAGTPVASETFVVFPFWLGSMPGNGWLDLQHLLQAEQRVSGWSSKADGDVFVLAAPRANENWCFTTGMCLGDNILADLVAVARK